MEDSESTQSADSVSDEVEPAEDDASTESGESSEASNTESGDSDDTESSEDISELPIIKYEEVDEELLAAEQALATAQLERYCDAAQVVMIGQVLTVFEQDNEQQVSLLIKEKLKGRPRGVMDIEIPAPIVTTDPTRIYPRVVEGYTMLVFLNRQGRLIEGNSLFLVQGGHAWRNKRPEAFLQPSSNRDWVEQVDPAQDYIVFSLDQIRACLE